MGHIELAETLTVPAAAPQSGPWPRGHRAGRPSVQACDARRAIEAGVGEKLVDDEGARLLGTKLLGNRRGGSQRAHQCNCNADNIRNSTLAQEDINANS